MKKILSALIRLVFTFVALYGIMCIFGEVEPWSVSAQIFLFVKGILLLFVCFLVCAFFEGRESK